MIYKKAELDDIRAQALKDGMRTMKQDGIYKIFGGYTAYAQLLRVVAEQSARVFFSVYINSGGLPLPAWASRALCLTV